MILGVNSFTLTNKRRYILWVDAAKKAETREKRILEALSKLENGIKM